jgi:hypothetical protein
MNLNKSTNEKEVYSIRSVRIQIASRFNHIRNSHSFNLWGIGYFEGVDNSIIILSTIISGTTAGIHGGAFFIQLSGAITVQFDATCFNTPSAL